MYVLGTLLSHPQPLQPPRTMHGRDATAGPPISFHHLSGCRGKRKGAIWIGAVVVPRLKTAGARLTADVRGCRSGGEGGGGGSSRAAATVAGVCVWGGGGQNMRAMVSSRAGAGLGRTPSLNGECPPETNGEEPGGQATMCTRVCDWVSDCTTRGQLAPAHGRLGVGVPGLPLGGPRQHGCIRARG